MKDIKFGNPQIGEVGRRHVLDCLDRNWCSQGEKTKQFEKEWGELFGYKHNFAVNNGTSADVASLMALYDLGAKEGDEVIAPACAFIAVGNSIRAAGFKPKFVDVKKDTMNIDPKEIEKYVTRKTVAIMPVHTMGKPAEMDKIMRVAKRKDLYVIEDACESHGAMFKGKYVGNWGDAANFSFFAAHVVYGVEGGMISTNSEDFAQSLDSVRNHGRADPGGWFDHPRRGLNFKISDLHSSVALDSVGDFWGTFGKRRDNFRYLSNQVRDLNKFVYFVGENSRKEFVSPHAFSVTLKDPNYDLEGLWNLLEDNGIQCKRNFGSIPTQHAAFADMGYKIGDFPNAEYLGDNGLHFGIHQTLEREDLDYVSDKLHVHFGKF